MDKTLRDYLDVFFLFYYTGIVSDQDWYREILQIRRVNLGRWVKKMWPGCPLLPNVSHLCLIVSCDLVFIGYVFFPFRPRTGNNFFLECFPVCICPVFCLDLQTCLVILDLWLSACLVFRFGLNGAASDSAPVCPNLWVLIRRNETCERLYQHTHVSSSWVITFPWSMKCP